jgi:hypothetical protein
MIIIGVDFHPKFQQIPLVDSASREFEEKRLMHREEAEEFYRALVAMGQKVQWAWGLADSVAGSSACWRSYRSSCVCCATALVGGST